MRRLVEGVLVPSILTLGILLAGTGDFLFADQVKQRLEADKEQESPSESEKEAEFENEKEEKLDSGQDSDSLGILSELPLLIKHYAALNGISDPCSPRSTRKLYLLFCKLLLDY